MQNVMCDGAAVDVFAGKLRDALQKQFGGAYRIECRRVRKNNNVILHGILITEEGRNVSPTIYVDTLYEAYEAGLTFRQAVERVVQMYEADARTDAVDMTFFRDFEQVKDRICWRLINRAKNEALLEEIPHIPFLDLAICFYYAYEDSVIGSGIINIYHSHRAIWGTDAETLQRLAAENTPRLFPEECSSMADVLLEMIACERDELSESEIRDFSREVPMYILSNRQRVNGAAGILYPGLLQRLSAELHSDLFLIPSSIHEFILLPDSGRESPSQIKKMIAEVNLTQLEEEDILSDELYYFEQKEGTIKII